MSRILKSGKTESCEIWQPDRACVTEQASAEQFAKNRRLAIAVLVALAALSPAAARADVVYVSSSNYGVTPVFVETSGPVDCQVRLTDSMYEAQHGGHAVWLLSKNVSGATRSIHFVNARAAAKLVVRFVSSPSEAHCSK